MWNPNELSLAGVVNGSLRVIRVQADFRIRFANLQWVPKHVSTLRPLPFRAPTTFFNNFKSFGKPWTSSIDLAAKTSLISKCSTHKLPKHQIFDFVEEKIPPGGVGGKKYFVFSKANPSYFDFIKSYIPSEHVFEPSEASKSRPQKCKFRVWICHTSSWSPLSGVSTY